MKSSAKSIRLSNGISLDYVEHGEPTGIPLIMLHGITDSWRSFEMPLPHLPAGIRAFAVSQRGHGDSDRPASGYRPRDFAADIAEFMNAQKIDRAVIAGHSMGSYIAQRFAIDYPDRLLGLVLMGSFYKAGNNPSVEEFWSLASDLTDPIPPAFALEFQQSTLAQPIPQAYLDLFVRESLKAPARVWKSALRAMIEDDHSQELAKINTSTLIVWGDKDAFCTRGDQDALLNGIAGSRLIVYEGAGHAMHWEEPERFAADLANFTLSIP